MPFMVCAVGHLVMSLPNRSKIRCGLLKRVGRLAMKGSIPEEIRTSCIKIGFYAQLPIWLNGPLSPWVRNQLQKCPRRACKVPFSMVGLGGNTNGSNRPVRSAGGRAPRRGFVSIFSTLH